MTSKNLPASFFSCLAVILVLSFGQHVSGTEKPLPVNDIKSSVSKEIDDGKYIDETAEYRVIVYYFHGKTRCYTCKRIERLTKEAVRESFDDEIRTGLIELKVINVEEKENSHFVKDYRLFTRSVVVSHIVKRSERRWKNLQKVWELVGDEKTFKEYIHREVEAYIS